MSLYQMQRSSPTNSWASSALLHVLCWQHCQLGWKCWSTCTVTVQWLIMGLCSTKPTETAVTNAASEDQMSGVTAIAVIWQLETSIDMLETCHMGDSLSRQNHWMKYMQSATQLATAAAGMQLIKQQEEFGHIECRAWHFCLWLFTSALVLQADDTLILDGGPVLHACSFSMHACLW